MNIAEIPLLTVPLELKAHEWRDSWQRFKVQSKKENEFT